MKQYLKSSGSKKNKNLRPIIYALSCMAFLFSCSTSGLSRPTGNVYPIVIPFYFE